MQSEFTQFNLDLLGGNEMGNDEHRGQNISSCLLPVLLVNNYQVPSANRGHHEYYAAAVILRLYKDMGTRKSTLISRLAEVSQQA